MGTFKVEARVWNPAKREQEKGVELLADNGSTYTVLPKSVLEGLGIEPMRKSPP